MIRDVPSRGSEIDDSAALARRSTSVKDLLERNTFPATAACSSDLEPLFVYDGDDEHALSLMPVLDALGQTSDLRVGIERLAAALTSAGVVGVTTFAEALVPLSPSSCKHR